MKTLMAMVDSIQWHQIAVKSRVLLVSPKAPMSSKYYCGTFRLYRSHIIHEVYMTDGSGEMHCL